MPTKKLLSASLIQILLCIFNSTTILQQTTVRKMTSPTPRPSGY
jgi:hypothetical protein